MRFTLALAAVAALVFWTGTAAAGKKNRCANGACGVSAPTVTALYTYEVPPPVPAAPPVMRHHHLPPAAPPVAPAPSVAAGCEAPAVQAGCSASAQSSGCSEGRGFFKRFKKKNRGCGG